MFEIFVVIFGFLNVFDIDVIFCYWVGDEFNMWLFEGYGVLELGGVKVNIFLKIEDEIKVVFILGKVEKMLVRLLVN